MKKISFFGSGVEIEKYGNSLPEIESISKILSEKYEKLLFGGTNIGLMGMFAKSSKKRGMKVICIVPKWLKESHSELIFEGDEIIITSGLNERKEILEKTDAVICYPGGIGTFDELFDTIAKISLGELDKIPIILYNFERFYSPILLQIEHGIKTGLIKKEVMENIHTFEKIDQLEKIIEVINK